VGKPLSDYLAEQKWGKIFQNISQLKEPDEILVNPDRKRQRFFKVVRSPVLDAKGNYQGAVLSFQDETARRRTEILKEEFLTIISHEIRTPLNIITGFSSLLKDSLSDRMEDEELEFFQAINDGTDRLTRTIKEISDVAELAAEAYSNRSRFNLQSAVHQALLNVDSRLKDKSIKIVQKMPGSECIAYGYEDLVARAVQHLLENAAEFSPDGSEITVNLSRNDDMWTVTVRDSGEGIPTEEIEKIFDGFYQAEDYITRTHEGLGLGLSIVKKTALLHGGDIKIQSKPGEGTKAFFSLPIYDEQKLEKTAAKADKLSEELTLLRKQILQYARDLASSYSEQKKVATQLEKTRDQLVRSEKLALMGQMAAGIAHEMNNVLFPVVGNADLILMKKDTLNPEVARLAQIIYDAGWKAANMLRQILDFSRKGGEGFEKINATDPIEGALKLVEFRLRESRIEVDRQYGETAFEINGNPGHLVQVFTNLVVNAIDAMEGGGRLSVTVAKHREERDNGPVESVEIRFIDTGTGIPDEISETIFDPFFTTKEEGKGTGLGLFIIHSIIEKHGGVVDIESEVGKGTAFIIRLPLA
jgi:signal transduction histidine kinase